MSEARKSDLIDIACNIPHATDKAVLVDDGTTKAWLPKSKIEVEPSTDGKSSIVTMPEWLALEKGLI